MLLSVVVLARGRVPETRHCLDALRRRTPGTVEVILVDNASSPPEARGLAALARAWPAVRLFRNRANRPFAAAVNSAVRRAKGDSVCLLNNDAVVSAGWRAGLEAALFSDSRIAAVGPRTDAMAPPAQLGRGQSGPPRETPVLGGFCLLLRRSVFTEAGGLDEGFAWGWEDMDLALRLRRGGRRLLLVPSVFVRHVGSLTISGLPAAYRERTDKANRRLFRSRWGRPGPLRSDALNILAASPAPWDEEAPEISLYVERGAAPLPAPLARGVRVECLVQGPGADRRAAAWRPPTRVAPLSEAAGRRVLLLPRGTLPAPGTLRRLLDALDSHPGTVAAGPLSRRTWLGWQRADHGEPTAPPRPVPFLRGGCLLVDRAAYSRAGGLDPGLEAADAEADLCLRLRRDGGGVLLVPAALAEGARRPRWNASTPSRERSARAMFARWGADPLAAA